MHIRLGSR